MIGEKIKKSVKKFELCLENKNVLTEAATGNYVVTPIIAALSGANVYAFTKNSKYGSIEDVKSQTYDLANRLEVTDRITIIDDFKKINLKKIDILTNTGFLRPINKDLINELSLNCVISLMWETWEYREDELDLDACYRKGIKVYGTNEDDERLKTKEYIGYTVLYHLLDNKYSPFSSNVLLIGCDYFVNPVEKILRQNNYVTKKILDYSYPFNFNLRDFSCIVILEHNSDQLVIGDEDAYLNQKDIPIGTFVIHICGKVKINSINHFKFIPDNPKKNGYMSYTADFIDIQAVIDLHTAGLKVAEGMLKANEMGLKESEYKNFMESNYPALAFENPKYW